MEKGVLVPKKRNPNSQSYVNTSMTQKVIQLMDPKIIEIVVAEIYRIPSLG